MCFLLSVHNNLWGIIIGENDFRLCMMLMVLLCNNCELKHKLLAIRCRTCGVMGVEGSGTGQEDELQLLNNIVYYH